MERSAFAAPALAAALAAVGAGCAGRGGTLIEADGSSTVGPYVTFAAEGFQKTERVALTVGISGTGGGFERFCRGETDLSNASRPIKDEEADSCRGDGVDFVEFHVANDALTVAVNGQNTWAECLTVDQLKRIWQPGSKVGSWKQVDPSFPGEPLRLYGPGTDSGTFDFFTDVIVGEEGASRSDYQASEDDNILVQGVAGDRGALGYFGFSYYDQNRDKLKAVAIDGGGGCVEPSAANVQKGTYKPLARPLFVYVKSASLQRGEVRAFLEYILENEREIAQGAQFVPLTAEQLAKARRDLEQATGS